MTPAARANVDKWLMRIKDIWLLLVSLAALVAWGIKLQAGQQMEAREREHMAAMVGAEIKRLDTRDDGVLAELGEIKADLKDMRKEQTAAAAAVTRVELLLRTDLRRVGPPAP